MLSNLYADSWNASMSAQPMTAADDAIALSPALIKIIWGWQS